MISFFVFKWLKPSSHNFFKKISMISFTSVFLSIFLSFMIIGGINYFHYSVEKSLKSDRFDLSFYLPPSLKKGTLTQINRDLVHNWDVHSIFSYSNLEGFLYNDDKKIPITLKMIDNPLFSKIFLNLKKGSFNTDIPSIMTSTTVARRLNLQIGSTINFATLDTKNADAESFLTLFRLKITGFFTNVMPESNIDAISPLSPLKDSIPYNIHEGILLNDTKDTDKMVAYLDQQFNIDSHTYKDSHSNFIYALQWEKILLFVVLFLVIFISFFIIYKSFQILLEYTRPYLSIIRVLGLPYSSIMLFLFIYILLNTLASILLSFLSVLFVFYGIIPFILKALHPHYTAYSSFLEHSFIFHSYEIFSIIGLEIICMLYAFFVPSLKLRKQSLLEGLKA